MLTDLGLEVEGTSEITSIPGGLDGVVVGEVLSCKPHPNADRLQVTSIRINQEDPLPIVCGASNVATGLKVAVATVGTTLYDGDGNPFQIKKSKIRGELSQGMICAEDELGLGTDHDGILVLDSSLEPGTPCASVFQIEKDFVFEIGLTPNRADAMSHMGVARDLRAACLLKKIPVTWTPPLLDDFEGHPSSHSIDIQIKEPERAPRYLGLLIRDVVIKDSPNWLQNRLKAIGISPKNNVVDITNYVLHDLGQPLHAFDAEKIKGEVVVQTLPQDTLFVTLDGQERKLHSEDLMICDGDTPLCIAGVFGGIHSGVSEQTQHIFLESAYFDSVSIRKTAKRHGLNTDASFRYERGIDPWMTEKALKRAALLIRELAGGTISSSINEKTQGENSSKKVVLKYQYLNETIGQVIPKETLVEILQSLDISIESETEKELQLNIPPYRVDVTRPADVVEEVLRVYGYNNITVSPNLRVPFPNFDSRSPHRVEEELAQLLIGFGFSEILNNSLTSPNFQSMDSSLNDTEGVHLLNPLGKELGQLRSSLLFSVLETIGFNLNRQAKQLKLFELGKSYSRNKDSFHEKKQVSLALVGDIYPENWDVLDSPSPFSYFKGIIENIWKRMDIPLTDCQYAGHPTISEGIEWKIGDNTLGRMGIVLSGITKKFDITKTVFFAELDWDILLKHAFKKNSTFTPIPKFPGSRRDFALLVSKEISFQAIKDLAYQTEKKVLKKVGLFDVYEGKKLPKNQKSYGVSFEFQDSNKTLTDKQIDKIMKKLQDRFEQDLEAKLR